MENKEKEKQVIDTERGQFHVVESSPQELEEMGYGYWCTTHRGGDYDIYSDGTRTIAIKTQEPEETITDEKLDKLTRQFIGLASTETIMSLTGLSQEEVDGMKIQLMKDAFKKTYDKPYGWEEEYEEQDQDKER